MILSLGYNDTTFLKIMSITIIINKIIPNIKPEDIVQAKFQKPSLIDNAARAFRENDKGKLKDFSIVSIHFDELVKIVKK